jgi:myosin-5
LNQGRDGGKIEGVDDAAELDGTMRALSTVGISVTTQWKLFGEELGPSGPDSYTRQAFSLRLLSFPQTLLGILSGVLWMGNIQVLPSGRGDASRIPEDDEALEVSSQLLGVSKETLAGWIVKKKITMRSETVVKELNQSQSIASRDSAAKYLYSCVFDWLVKQINTVLGSGGSMSKSKTFIGILDIYGSFRPVFLYYIFIIIFFDLLNNPGFEHFKINSFEQFCINCKSLQFMSASSAARPLTTLFEI